MKIQINKNIYRAEIFMSLLAEYGVEHVCVSPGSRNTPLIFALQNSPLNKHIILDERSSAFFALGLAKSSGKAVAIITTSGTAAAELYPAIVEARMSRIPLLICTADRPSELRGSGANQTIFQDGMYGKHVVHEVDLGLPFVDSSSIQDYQEKIISAFHKSVAGPVHLNFPFDKPFEPDQMTDEIREDFYHKDTKTQSNIFEKENFNYKNTKIQKYKITGNTLIFCGWGNWTEEERQAILNFTQNKDCKIIADAASGFRSYKHPSIIRNAAAFLDEELSEQIEYKSLIQFGAIPTSKPLNTFWKTSNSRKFCVHPYDHHDESLNSEWISSDILSFTSDIDTNNTNNTSLNHDLDKREEISEKLKLDFLAKSPWNFEGRIQHTVHKYFPTESLLIYGNSSTIRDVDLFVSHQPDNAQIIVNRGASGIDGLLSTALGATVHHKGSAFLITGDLSFFYDISALQTARNKQIPLCVILINNHGGGIFHRLPVAKYPEVFQDFFISDQNISFSKLLSAWDLPFIKTNSEIELLNALEDYKKSPKFMLIEVETNAEESQSLRNDYIKIINKNETYY